MAQFATRSLSERRRKEITSLLRRKGREEHGQFMIEGRRSVEAALVAGAPLVDVIVGSERADWLAAVDDPAIDVWTAPASVLERLGDARSSQGVIATCALRWDSAEGALAQSRTLILDGVQDPGNVGTLLRTAAWFGVGGVIAMPGTADMFAPKTVRGTMGALWDLVVARGDGDELLQAIRASRKPVWVADMDGVPVREWAPEDRGVLVVGSEAHGPSAMLKRLAAHSVTIPSVGRRKGVESLNVAAAGAVIMAAWC